jgi:hypothetical protein
MYVSLTWVVRLKQSTAECRFGTEGYVRYGTGVWMRSASRVSSSDDLPRWAVARTRCSHRLTNLPSVLSTVVY